MKQSRRDDPPIVKASRYAALGFEFAGIVVAGVVAGYYIDGFLGTAPLFTLLLTLGGMAGAVYRLLWGLKQSNAHSGHGG
ncbi:MAG: AtpZ/AtpI family protein [Candidatus Binatia bacterium]